MRPTILAFLAASTVLAGSALAQTPANPPAQQPAPARAQPASPQTQQIKHSGEWRASKMIGVNVYNPQNEKVGDINEILLDRSGKIVGVVIGVGGFLGMGEHDVLVKMEDLKFMTEPVRTTAAPANRPNTGTNAPANRPARAANEKWYPDHVVIQSTKEQLKAMPGFKYSSYN